jgi:hypothetical protein
VLGVAMIGWLSAHATSIPRQHRPSSAHAYHTDGLCSSEDSDIGRATLAGLNAMTAAAEACSNVLKFFNTNSARLRSCTHVFDKSCSLARRSSALRS